MIIGIDVSTVNYQTGVSNYTLNLVRNLINLDKTNHYKLFYSSLRLPIPKELQELKLKPNVTIYCFRLPPTILQILWNQLRLFPIELFIGKCDIFHTSDWTQPPTLKAKTITTIHDLTSFLYPEWLHERIVSTQKNKMYWAAKECHHFICVSENTKNDVIKTFPNIDINKCSVVYEAAEDKYSQFLKQKKSLQENKKIAIEKQYGLKKYILAQGTREPRKNLPRLIEAFNRYRQKFPKSKIELAIAGKYGWGNDILHLKNHAVKILGYIPEKDMVALHASALFLAYPSLYEGFGLPVIKSMKVGVPVLTSNTSSMPEIIGTSGITVDPYSVDSIYSALSKLISDSALRKRLSKKALETSVRFSLDETAKNTLKIYNYLFNK